MFRLSDIQHDALVEIFNIGVGQAAAAMSAIVQEEVLMSVPTILFQSRAEVARTLGDGGNRICAVTQNFVGPFNTEAVLMFPEDKSMEIVRLMVGQSLTMEELGEMEQEAMSEIGNIILNSCVGAIANVSGTELNGSLPLYQVGTGEEILRVSGNGEGLVLTLKIDFNIEKHRIHGYVAFLLDLSALQDLRHYIDRYLDGLKA
jgi:chemotaxis protein CheC